MERIDFAEIMKEKYGLDIHNATLEEVNELLQKHHIKGDFGNNISRGIDNLWKNLRKEISGPAFLINHPKFLSPLAKSKFDQPHITERFQPIIAGSELGNGWSELNDPLDQLARFKEQQELRDSGDDEAQFLDIDYVEMLEYGMPPTFGWGHSERVFWFLEDVTAREGVPFPQLKHELDETTVEIYGRNFLGLNSHEVTNENGNIDESRDNISTQKTAKETQTSTTQKNTQENTSKFSNTQGKLPTREEVFALLEKHVQDDYQKLHARMVAEVLEAYAKKFGYDPDLWFITGLLHDLDYYEFPGEHPRQELEWFSDWGYPQELIHAVEAHARSIIGTEPQTVLASAILATDELCGFLYAYSLMRPEGFDGMKTSSALKKFKERSFAAKVDRDEILAGVESFKDVSGELADHMEFLIKVFQEFFPKEA